MAHRGRADEEEAEPILVEFIGSRAILRLDDGDKLEFDLSHCSRSFIQSWRQPT
jgi:hypothetical protein